MKVEDFSSSGNPSHAPELPDDFARGVIVKARALQRQWKIRGRIAAGVAVMLIAAAVPLANRIPSRPGNFSARDSAANDALASSQQDTDQATALRLAEAANPDAVGDYLLPNTTALTQFASAYSDASWDYDPDWTANSDVSIGS